MAAWLAVERISCSHLGESGLGKSEKNEKKLKKIKLFVEKNENFGKKKKKNIDLSEKKSQKNGNFGKKK
jgi:hypothetical protein